MADRLVGAGRGFVKPLRDDQGDDLPDFVLVEEPNVAVEVWGSRAGSSTTCGGGPSSASTNGGPTLPLLQWDVTDPPPDVELHAAAALGERPRALRCRLVLNPRGVRPFRAGGAGAARCRPHAADPRGAVMSTMSSDEVYAAVIRQAAHDAVRAQLAAPSDSVAGSLGLRAVTDWLAAAYGAGAVRDLAEELAVDLAEAFAALAAAEGRPALAVLDGWFHDVPRPCPAATRPPAEATAAGPPADSSPSRGPPRGTHHADGPGDRRSRHRAADGRTPRRERPDGAARATRRPGSCGSDGQHGEQLASIGEQLRELAEQLQLTSTRHADLAAAVSEDLAPKVGGLHQVLTEELGQLRGDVDVLLNERKERDKTKNAPVDWAALTEDQAAVQWPILARWVGGGAGGALRADPRRAPGLLGAAPAGGRRAVLAAHRLRGGLPAPVPARRWPRTGTPGGARRC